MQIRPLPTPTADRDWLAPYAGLAAFQMVLAGNPFSAIVGSYLVLGLVTVGVCVAFRAIRWAGKVEYPLREAPEAIRAASGPFAAKALGVIVAAIYMASFSTLKAGIPSVVPFYADDPLRQFDQLIFGQDAWRLFFDAFGFTLLPLSFVYNAFVLTQLIAFTAVIMAPASAIKTRLILTYALMWSILGVVLAYAFSSVGPLFYDPLKGTNEFAELRAALSGAWANIGASEYVWSSFQKGALVPGAGLSAMPSLHVAGSLWIALAVRVYFPRFAFLGWVYFALIYIGSVMLGWHYTTDGIVGALGTWAIWKLCQFNRKPRPVVSRQGLVGARREA